MSKPSVVVIMGGSSLERKFSLQSGRNVVDALEATGHEVLPVDADENLVATLRAERPDVAFIALHGAGGEDGAIPSLLNFLEIPYVGSSPEVCRTTWNKPEMPFIMNRTFSPQDTVVRWPAQVSLPENAFRDLGAAGALDLVPAKLGGFPLCVKPACGGSAMGLSKVSAQDQLGEALMAALAYDDCAMMLEWVEGVELSLTVIGDPGDEQVLPPVEICPKGGLFDTEARLDSELVDYFCPVRPESLSSDPQAAEVIRNTCERAAIEVFRAYRCRDIARVDMVWDGACPRILDLKVFPGLTKTSLVPMAIAAADIDFAGLLDEMVQVAYERGC